MRSLVEPEYKIELEIFLRGVGRPDHSVIPLTLITRQSSQMPGSVAQNQPAPVALEKQLSPPFRPRLVARRRLRISFFGLLLVATLALFYRHHKTPPPSDDILVPLQDLPQSEGGTDPPRFYGWHDREKQLPQHDLTLPYPQGRDGRYIYFANQACCASFHFYFSASMCPQP